MPTPTLMRREVNEIPQATARLLEGCREALADAGAALAQLDPPVLASVARGSSDHAATYLKYACELTVGRPVASLGPSVASIYGRQPRLGGGAVLSVSQSGQSPDIVAMQQALGESGALTIAITNDPSSPLGQGADHAIDILAGPERSVAATKTVISSAVAGLAILAAWAGDDELRGALDRLPDLFAHALDLDWSPMIEAIGERNSLYVLGRGPAMAISNEAALKFKETCRIHAESYSSAEVLHGPVTIVGDGFPVLAMVARDAAEQSVTDVADRIAGRGAAVFATTDRVTTARRLPFVASGHPLTDPLAQLVAFYGLVEALARHRGLNPDEPRHLNKVTETV